MFSDLGGYRRDAFPGDQYASKRLASGYDYFPSALRQDWDSLSEMMSKAVIFVDEFDTELTTLGGMPSTFAQKVIDAQTAYEEKYQMYLNAGEIARMQTDAKIAANNALYKALMKMFGDGKKVFRGAPALRSQFVFSDLWIQVGKNNGRKGHIAVSGIAVLLPSGLPGVGVTITLTIDVKVVEVVTNATGNYVMVVKDVEEDTQVMMTATYPEHEPQTVTVTLHPGEDVVQHFGLNPVAPMPPVTVLT